MKPGQQSGLLRLRGPRFGPRVWDQPDAIFGRMQPRALPRVGASVVVHFLAAQVHGEVVSVDADLRGLEVLTDEGDLIRFVLAR